MFNRRSSQVKIGWLLLAVYHALLSVVVSFARQPVRRTTDAWQILPNAPQIQRMKLPHSPPKSIDSLRAAPSLQALVLTNSKGSRNPCPAYH